jgi:hypothetical protein
VEEEITQDGMSIYKMTLKSKIGTYIRGVSAANWEDDRARKSIEKSWLHDIGEIEAAKKIRDSKTEDVKKAEMKAKIKDIEGLNIENE